MPNSRVYCPVCQGNLRSEPIEVECNPRAELHGIIKCLACSHEFPITLTNGYIKRLDTSLPGAYSQKLNETVPEDIVNDIKEAERAFYAQCNKASAVMCGRALQLSLIDKGIKDKPLSAMLSEAKQMGLLTNDTYTFSKSIKAFRDIGTHRRDVLEPEQVNLTIYASVALINELFQK